MDFTLDTNAARAADQRNGRITESGKYIGTLTRAEFVKSKNGTKGVEFTFSVDEHTSADYLTIWTEKADGTELSGRKSIMALMVCLKMREAKTGSIEVEKYDSDTQKRVKVTVGGYPEMMHKQIGIVLQKELYTSNAGADKERVTPLAWFCAETERTAGEILDRKNEPVALPKLMQWLADNPVKDSRTKHAGTVPHPPGRSMAQAAAQGTGSSFASMDDDIPFAPLGLQYRFALHCI
ncbi:hypothetical protein [Laribacter hongkongensis]|uniref:hypothetical protein n=1 Tax=Laribacter hongkongensis TaxID=168471 RepID=UPI001EFCB0A5|nr:hypothetical protein [Laribacter hongkongensis]MCG9081254.1 hypothetical protein [Laribacter hongkongensis]